MINYKWYITNINCIKQEGELIDIVYKIDWVRIAYTIFDEKEVQTLISGEMICSAPSKDNFTPYNELTYEQVCDWLDNGLNVSEINKKLDTQIQNITQPPIVSLPIPFQQ
jgi:hypothetical protein